MKRHCPNKHLLTWHQVIPHSHSHFHVSCLIHYMFWLPACIPGGMTRKDSFKLLTRGYKSKTKRLRNCHDSYLRRSSWAAAAWQWSCPACTRSVCGDGPFSGRYPESLGSYSQDTRCLRTPRAPETWLKHWTPNKPLTAGWLAGTHSPTHTLPPTEKLHIQAQKALSELGRIAEQSLGGGVPTLQPVCAGHVTTGRPMAGEQWEYCPPCWAESNVCVNACQLPPALEGNINTIGMPMNWLRRAGVEERGVWEGLQK